MSTVLDFSSSSEWADLIYNGNPEFKRIKELGKYLRNKKDTIVRLYHGTNAKFDILEEGLKPTSRVRRRSIQSSSGYVYLSVYPGMAKSFGEFAYPGKSISVYAVDIAIKELKADLDQLRNQRYWAQKNIGNTLAESIVYGHGARVKGKIYPYLISKIS